MNYNFDNNMPIYIQLQEKIRLKIVSGIIKPGERLLSVRELALNMKVNPNTMQKALQELENEGLIYTERTNGKFVTEDVNLIKESKNKLANEMVINYFDSMKSIGMTHHEAISYLQKLGGKI